MFVGKKLEVQLFGGTIVPHPPPLKPLSDTPPSGSLAECESRSLPTAKLFDRENNPV